MSASPLSPRMVRALCLIAGHGGLKRYRTGYGLSRAEARMVSLATVAALERRDLARMVRGLAVLTALGAAALDVGLPEIEQGREPLWPPRPLELGA